MHASLKSITATTLAAITLLASWPTRLVGSGSCFEVVTHPSEAVKCQCRSNWAGTDGTCDARTYTKDAHDLCMSSGSGYWHCDNDWKDIGWNANCTTEVNWSQWTYCYVLSGALCGLACGVRPTSPSCIACLANLSRGCFGCSIRYCLEGERTPLYCHKVAPGNPTGPGCPGTKP